MVGLIRYAPLAAALLLGVAALFLWGQLGRAEADRDAARVQVTALTEANRMVEKARQDLVRQREIDSRLLASLSTEIQALRDETEQTRLDILGLEHADETVRDYLNTPIPESLRSILAR